MMKTLFSIFFWRRRSPAYLLETSEGILRDIIACRVKTLEGTSTYQNMELYRLCLWQFIKLHNIKSLPDLQQYVAANYNSLLRIALPEDQLQLAQLKKQLEPC